jgi:hypothetical protein
MSFFNRCVALRASDAIRKRQLRMLLKSVDCHPVGRFELGQKMLASLILILSSACVAMAGPSPSLHKRHTAHAGETETVGKPQFSEPPRMIEVRPGWWISTYDCVTDEGQGRFRPCSAGGT